MYTFHELPGRPADWDQRIASYDTKTLFHESAWLDHLLSIHPSGRIDYYEVKNGADPVGYHCGLRVSKFGLPIHGSPLGGTGTNYMGPVVDRDVDQTALIRGLVGMFGIRRFLHLELSHSWLDRTTMEAAGFNVHEDVTHIVPLPEDEEQAWSALRGTARNRIRKAQGNGLVVETLDSPNIVDEFFAQFTEVYAKQGMVTPFGRERPQSLFDHLHPAGRLLVLAVRKDATVLASGLFPFDDKCVYFWGAASWLAHQKFSPNELLHWQVIRFAVQRGLSAYNMCGGRSQFKNKFGGADVEYLHFSKSAVPGLALLRKAYRSYHFHRLKRGSAELGRSEV